MPIEAAAVRKPGDPARALLEAARPRQWVKNLFVYVAVVFTNNVPLSLADTQRLRTFGIATAAFGIFCALSAAVYLVNDAMDAEQDRLHPEKRHRPVASGRLPAGVAIAAAALLAVAACTASFAVNAAFGLSAAGYLVLQVAYTFWLKHLVLLDVFAIAAGFVLRAVAGGLAIRVSVTVWLLVCTFQLALFLGFGKRRAELVALAGDAANHRATLDHYSVPFLDQLIAIVLGALTVSYAVYTIMSDSAVRHPYLVMTLPNVLYGIFRYLYLIHQRHEGGSPERIVLTDRPMQANLALWLVEVLIAMKIGA